MIASLCCPPVTVVALDLVGERHPAVGTHPVLHAKKSHSLFSWGSITTYGVHSPKRKNFRKKEMGRKAAHD